MTDKWREITSTDELPIAENVPSHTVEDLKRKDFVKYAGASGDFNPMHYDEVYAKKAGNPSPFAQGMLTGGFVAHYVSDWFGLDNIHRLRIRFISRVWPGDSITVSGEIINIESKGNHTIVKANLQALNQNSDPVVSGGVTAKFTD